MTMGQKGQERGERPNVEVGGRERERKREKPELEIDECTVGVDFRRGRD